MAGLMTRTESLVSWVAQLAAAGILAQTLYFKFSGSSESRAIFSALGAEPWGRIASGVLELVAVLLLLSGRWAALGAALAAGAMAGAIGAHAMKLGIEVQGDGGLLFALALATLFASLLVLWLRRRELPLVGSRAKKPG